MRKVTETGDDSIVALRGGVLRLRRLKVTIRSFLLSGRNKRRLRFHLCISIFTRVAWVVWP